MGNRQFQTFQEASKFAKMIAKETNTSPITYRQDQMWVVEGDQVKGNQSSGENQISLNRINSKWFEINDLDVLIDKMKSITDDNSNNGNLIEILNSLLILSDLVKDIAKVKTKEYAVDMAYEFGGLVEVLSQFKISAMASRYKLEMLRLSNELPSENGFENNADRLRRINKLEESKGLCKKNDCSGRYVIRGVEGNEFWGCSLFPTCWSKMNLTKEEIDLLH